MAHHYNWNICERTFEKNMERLRLATNEDMALLFEWANDRSVRNLSFCSEPISWEMHVEWFQQMMHSQDVIQFIYECDDKLVGQVRLRIHNGAGLISYSIASEYRGNGKATQMSIQNSKNWLQK